MRWNNYRIHFKNGKPQYANYTLEPHCDDDDTEQLTNRIVMYLQSCGFVINTAKAQFYSSDWECGYNIYFNKEEEEEQ